MSAYVFDGVRTPRGKGSPRGALHGVSPLDLVTQLASALEGRSGFDPACVDDVVLGVASQVDGQGANPARTAALLAGWGHDVPGVTINRFCASGLDAVNLAAAKVRAGDAELVVGGGVESTSRVPMFSDRGALWSDAAVIEAVGSVHMGIAADLCATEEGFGREALDQYALNTRRKARQAAEAGHPSRSLIPVRGPDGHICLDHDELLGFQPTSEALAALAPAFAELGAAGQDDLVRSKRPEIVEIRHDHTRATSPPLADGAALVLLGSAAAGERFERGPRARIVGSVACASDPVTMLTAGQTAVERLLARHGLSPSDIGVFEFAEAFSAVCLRFQRDLEVGDDRFNIGGGTLALGHAFGATGAILLLNTVDALERTDRQLGVAAVSGAAGVGVATLVERWVGPAR